MPLKFLTVQQALDYIERLDLDEFSADEWSITCLPPNSGHITDEENFIENNLDEIVPVDVSREVELNLKRRETTKASILAMWCEKCKVMLHKNCLIPFHSKMYKKKAIKQVRKFTSFFILKLQHN